MHACMRSSYIARIEHADLHAVWVCHAYKFEQLHEWLL